MQPNLFTTPEELAQKEATAKSTSQFQIHDSWKPILAEESDKPYFQELKSFLVQEIKDGKAIYPPPKLIFEAFNLCPLEQVKVVILGQDPYHGKGQCHGPCFSVNRGVPIPPSLQNIYKELQTDIGMPTPSHGNLESWARQGVLMLNAVLTVRAHAPTSHSGKGWEYFTDRIIQVLNDEREHLVFLLWGRYAQEKGRVIDPGKHLVLTAAHPSPFSANNGFFGCKHFSRTNEYLTSHGITPIDWHVPK